MVDIGVSLSLLVVAAPIALAAAVAVRATSKGPVIFRQQRVGRHGRRFDILKFRTMRASRPGDSEITVGDDPRITRVGRFLRRSKIDELPQLINVLLGEMSLVGPRPEVPSFVAQYPEELRRMIQSVRPGITDRASIKYRHENDLLARQPDPDAFYREVILPDKLAMGAAYARRHSLAEDVRILAATVRTVLRDR